MEKINFVNDETPALNAQNLNQLQTNIETAIEIGGVSGDTLPVGTIVPFASANIPANWLACDGSEVSRTKYELLFNVIGETYGAGDGKTTFRLPNMRGRVPIGIDDNDNTMDTLGKTGGEKTHTLTIEEMPAHKHELKFATHNDSGKGGNVSLTNDVTVGIDDSACYSTGGNQAHNIMQPYMITNYIIKARQSAGIVATVEDTLNSTSTTNALSANMGNVLKRKVATLSLQNEYISTGYNAKIPLNLFNSNTDLLSTNGNGDIVIGKGVSKILVSANCFAEKYDTDAPYLWTTIEKLHNNEATRVSTAICGMTDYYASTVHSPILIDVEEGDTFSLRSLIEQLIKIRNYGNTYLTVEVIE